MLMNSKVLNLIGLATRAGKVITGIELCEKALKQRKAKLVVLTKETSDSTTKIFEKSSVPLVFVESKEMLGKYTGKDIRSVAVIVDEGFARAILKESGEA